MESSLAAKTMPWRSRLNTKTITTWLLLLVMLPMLAVLFLRNLDHLDNYHGDENLWVGVGSRAFQLYFIDHNLSDPFWQDDLYTWGAYHPQIGKYVIGVGTYLAGYRSVPLVLYNFQHNVAWNIARGIVLPPHLIQAGRIPVALLGLATCVLFYWLVTLVADCWYGLLAVYGLLAGPLLLMTSRRAMIDTPAVCFSVLTMLCLVYLLRALRTASWYQPLLWAVATGLAGGMAAGAKMNAVLSVAVCGVALMLVCGVDIWRTHRRPVLPAICGLLILAWAWLVFFITNPFLYHSPIAGVRHMLNLTALLHINLSRWEVHTPAEKAWAMWNGTIQYAPLHQLGISVDIWLLLLGGLGLALTAWRSPTTFWNSGLMVMVIWVVVTYVGVGLWLPAAADRYFLPLQPPNAFIEAYGLIWLITLLRQALARFGRLPVAMRQS